MHEFDFDVSRDAGGDVDATLLHGFEDLPANIVTIFRTLAVLGVLMPTVGLCLLSAALYEAAARRLRR